jgi:hypothetical protein
MRYVILHRAVQQGPKFQSQEQALAYAHKNGFTKEARSIEELDEGYRIVEVSAWKH